MNPNYNQQHYNYHQHNPGPPQPPWQPDPSRRTGWGDPRPQDLQHSSLNSPSPYYPPPPPPPPPPVQPASYNPAQVQGSGYWAANQYNTSQWGVKYNQTQSQHLQPQPQSPYDEQRPALPPRPNSALAQANQASSPAPGWQQHAIAPSPSAQDPRTYQQAQSQYNRPPTPPPRPSAYASQAQVPQESIPHPQYSHHAPTHHYDPPAQQHFFAQAQSASAPAWSQDHQIPDGTVSPLEEGHRRYSIANRSQNVSPIPYQNHRPGQPIQQTSGPDHSDVQVGATALGHGQPSDWQHYYVSEFHDKDTKRPNVPIAQTSDNSQSIVASPVQMHAAPATESHERVQPPPRTVQAYQNIQDIQSAQQPDTRLNQVQSQSPDKSLPQGHQTHNQRMGNMSTASSLSSIQRTGTIDSVIQAWNAPLHGTSATQLPISHPSEDQKVASSTEPSHKIQTLDNQTQTDFPPVVKVEKQTETKVEIKEIEVDPYKDITDGYGATLKRFADMLRQEAAAEDDGVKFRIFQGFVNRELRLRGVLYGVEVNQATEASHAISEKKASLSDSKPLSAANAEPIDGSGTTHASVRSLTPTVRPSLTTEPSTPGSKDDSYVVVDAEDRDGDYSPGGRPRVTPDRARTPRIEVPTHPKSNIQSFTAKAADVQISPSVNAPMTLEDYVMSERPSPSNDAPMLANFDHLEQSVHQSPPIAAVASEPINFQPPRPVYTPFRYNEDLNQPAPTITVDVSGDDYGTLRQNQALEAGRMLVHDAAPSSSKDVIDRGHAKTPSLGRREHEEAFIGLIRQQSKAIRKKPSTAPENPPQLRIGTPVSSSTPGPTKVLPPLTKSVLALRAAVPKNTFSDVKSCHPKLEPISAGLSNIKDDFGFIHATVLAWDKMNRRIRQQLETERATRQSENESRVDELFHDNEIGYADIANLESEFKLTEAEKKYQEDKLELESFVKEVFEEVVNRLEDELAQLSKLHTLARDLLDLSSESKGQGLLASTGDKAGHTEKVPMADLMDLMLHMFSKIEIRHQKVAEAHFERERRKKKLELSIFYTNGDTAGIKKLEKDFATAETIQILEEARRKDERANRLMDSFDRAVVRGLAENQVWIEDVLPKLQFLRDLVLGSEDNGPKDQSERDDLLYGDGGIKSLMATVQSAIDLIHKDSRHLVQLSLSADQILNEADFGMYLAEGKITGSDEVKFEKLRQDKVKEDEKIREDFEGRLNGVSRDPEEILSLTREVMGRIGNDKEHKARIERALEEAKRRNTSGKAVDGTL